MSGAGSGCKANGRESKVRRVFTGYDTKDYRNCQYIKWVLVFRDWARRCEPEEWGAIVNHPALADG
jgi:hypothetical protein